MSSPFSMSWDPINDRPTMIEHDERPTDNGQQTRTDLRQPLSSAK